MTEHNLAEIIADNPQYPIRQSLFNICPKTKADIVFIGDSITQRCEWNELLPKYKVKNRGIGNDTSFGVLNRINDDITVYNPDKIFIMIGINDLEQGGVIKDIVGNYDEILKKLKDLLPNTSVYIQSVLPVNSKLREISNKVVQSLNNELVKLAQKYQVPFIDLYSLMIDDENQLKTDLSIDGVHLMGQAYKIWIDKIRPLIEDRVL